MRLLPIIAVLVALAGCGDTVRAPDWSSISDATVTDIKGAPYPFAQHRSQVLLIVNVASKCGFTTQYAGLQALYAGRKDKGLVLIGVPSNDFGIFSGQEPGTAAEIQTFCHSTYGVTFPMMAKVDVKGDNEVPPLPLADHPARVRGRVMEFQQIPHRPRRHHGAPVRFDDHAGRSGVVGGDRCGVGAALKHDRETVDQGNARPGKRPCTAPLMPSCPSSRSAPCPAPALRRRSTARPSSTP